MGLGHIGVLEWLEANRIPIDYIAGTSMGGLVAGMYATGKRPREIRELITRINWDRVLRGQVPYRDLIYRRKEDKRAVQNDIELGLRNGLSLPAGLNPGQEIGLILQSVALPYSSVRNFDDLPIPFRCVATELTAAESHVFKDGYLGDALRATMSIPAFFTPVKRDGKVYADGGLLDNLPVDVVREMGADIVIAVHLQVKGYEDKDIGSPFATLGRSITVVIMQNEIRSMAKADLLITVPVQDFTTLDYERGNEIADRGRAGAEKKSAVLARFALPESDWRQHLAQRDSRMRRTLPVPEFVEVNIQKKELADSIHQQVDENIGRPVDLDRLTQEALRITGTGRFSKVDYSILDRDGRPGLLVTAEEKSHAPPTLLGGVNIDGADFNNVQFTVGGRLTFLDVGSYRSEVRLDARVGSIYAASAEYYRPFNGRSRWFFAPSGFADDVPLSIYRSGERIADYRVRRAGGGIDFGITADRYSEFRAGYRGLAISVDRKVGDPLLPSFDSSQRAVSFRFIRDRLDSPFVPREGYLVRSRFEIWDKNLASTGAFPLAEVESVWAHPITKPGSLLLQAQGGTVFGRDQNVGLPVFTLGGVARLAAYGTNEFLTNQYFLFRASYLHELGRLPVFAGRRILALGGYELGKAYGNQPSKLPNNATVGLAVETLIGPVFIGGAVGDGGRQKIYFQIGRLF